MSKTEQKKIFTTEDYDDTDRQVINAGGIGSKGVLVLIESNDDLSMPIRENSGDYGVFWSLNCIIKGAVEDAFVINFGSMKLHKLFVGCWEQIKDKWFILSAEGEGFERKYTIALQN